MKFRQKTRGEELGFQIAPMIDIVFILLSFFVATQIFAKWETEIDIKLPTAATGKQPRRLPGEIIVNVLMDGRTSVNRQVLDEQRLASLLARIVQLFPGQPVLIRADRKTQYGHVIRVLDMCRQTDIWNISFATDAEPE